MAITAPSLPPVAAAPAVYRTIWQEARRRFLRNRLATTGLGVVVVFVIFAVFADVLAPTAYDRSVLSETLQYPSARHWLGTDQVGRDLLSRIIFGARTSLAVGFSVQALAFGIGIPLGVIGGLRPGTWIDFIVIRLVEVMSAFPNFLFALFILTVIGGGLTNVIFAIGITSWIEVTRLTRAQVLSLRERDFVQAARALGAHDARIIVRHILPNVAAPVLVIWTLEVARVILMESALSFLGLGVPPPTPTWGRMLAEGRDYLTVAGWIAIFPGLAIMITVLGINFLGDGLRDLLDPRLRQQT